MKKLLLVSIMGLVVMAIFGQTPVLLRSSQYLDFNGTRVQLSNASSMVFWNDTSNGTSDIYAQKLSADGIPLWPSVRVIISNPLENRLVSAVASSDGNIVLLYSTSNLADYSTILSLQKISLAGQILWNPEGIIVSGFGYYANNVSLVPNNIGGAFVVFPGQSNYSEVFTRNYNANGVNQWPVTALYTVPSQMELKAISDGNGGLMINSKYWTSGTGTANHLARLNAEGDIVGSIPLLSPTAVVPIGYDIVRNSEGFYFLYTFMDNSFQVQKMTENGNLLFPAIVNNALNMPGFYAYSMKVQPGNDGGVHYMVMAYDNSYVHTLYLNRLNSLAQQQWTAPLLISGIENINGYDLAVNANNDAWLTWAHSIYYYEPDTSIKTVRVTADGSLAFSPFSVSSVQRYKMGPLVMAQADKTVLVWNDQSVENSSLACQTVTNSGNITQQAGGNMFHSILNGSVTLQRTLSLGDKFIYIYDDSRMGWNNKIYFQITNQNIVPQLESNGRALNSQVNPSEKFLDCLVLPNNRLALLYSVYQNGFNHLYLQEISSNGSLIHSDLGMLINGNSPQDYTRAKLSLAEGDLLITWPSYTSDSNYMGIAGQRYHNNLPLWDAGGKILIPASNSYVYQNALVGNYLVYALEDYSNFNYSLRALLLDSNGNPAPGWSNLGIQVIEPNDAYYQPFFNAGLQDDKLVCFFADASYEGYRSMAQMLDAAGNRVWGENGLTLEANDEWNMYQVTDAVYKDNISCLLHPDSNTGSYLHKISPSGEMLFGATGTILDYAWNTVQDPTLIQYTNGSYSVLWKGWEDQFGRICHRYVSPDGTVSDSEPLSIAVNGYGFWNMDTAENNNIGVVAYTDNNQYYYAKGDGIPLNSLWACKIIAPSVSADDPVQNPAVLSSHNYPNPFNPSTTIRFNLKEKHPVKVEIFNAKGQLVRELLNEAKATGEYEVLWNGTDNQGRSVASGVYLYKIQAGKYSNTKKMMLMK